MQKAIEKTTLMSLFSRAADMQLAKGDTIPADIKAKATGSVYRKQLFTYGTWINPNWWWDDELVMDLTQELALAMKANFDNNTIGSRLPIPRNHTGDVNANAGEVIGLDVQTDALYVWLDVRDDETVADIDKGLIWDVSAGFDFDWQSQKDGSHHGPCLLHVALTDEPYINNMTSFEKLELSKREDKFSKQFAIDGKQSVIMMSKNVIKELNMITFSKVKNDKEYAVPVTYKDANGNDVTIKLAPGAEVDVPETVAEEVTAQITDSVAPEADAEEEAETTPPETAAPAEADADKDAETDLKKELAKAKQKNAEYEAEKTFDKLLSKGKVFPAQKELFLSMATNTSVALSADIKISDKITLSKDKQDSTSVVTLLSAILEAGPTLKLAEQGAEGEDTKEVELSQEEKDKVIALGGDPKKVAEARAKRNAK